MTLLSTGVQQGANDGSTPTNTLSPPHVAWYGQLYHHFVTSILKQRRRHTPASILPRDENGSGRAPASVTRNVFRDPKPAFRFRERFP